jgi:hypothetical protein
MNIDNIFNRINEFCLVKEKVDNFSDTYRKTPELSNRLKFIINLVEELGISHELVSVDYDDYYEDGSPVYFHNLLLRGGSGRYISAHYDIFNIDSHNANDNSASVINAIALKVLNPDVNIILLDAEEQPYCCEGSRWQSLWMRSCKEATKKVDFIINLELTGLGGKNFVVAEDDNGDCQYTIIKHFNPLVKKLPRNDAYYFRRHTNDAVCISTYPLVNNEPNFDHFRKIHTTDDNLLSISIEDMKEFVIEVLLPITQIN